MSIFLNKVKDTLYFITDMGQKSYIATGYLCVMLGKKTYI